MIETLRCPACHASYGLRPERVRPGIRRAQCARCPEIFDIEEAVARLLGSPVPEPPAHEPIEVGEPTLAMPVFAEPLLEEEAVAHLLESPVPEPPAREPIEVGEPTLAMPVFAEPLLELETAAISPEDLLPPAPPAFDGIPDILRAPEPPDTALTFLEPLAPLDAPQDAPSLTLHDLEGTDEEILDKTLLMEVMPTAPAEQEGFASAKDAISRILGGLDAPAGHSHPHAGRMARSQGVDMEATLSALDHSLGAPAQPLPPVPTPEPAPTAPGTATTVRISIEDIRAAIDSVPVPPPPAAPEVAPAPPSLPAPTPAPLPPPAPMPTFRPDAMDTMPGQDPNLLKVQVGNEVFTNVSVEQLTQWIEQGRVLETHQVARQFSDHWIDATKVPALRPVFDRVRRARIEAGAPSSVLEAPQKKSLFSGLFGRN